MTLHAEFDDYKPDLLLPDPEKSGNLFSQRMIPPVDWKYYFMVEEEKMMLADDQTQEDWKLIENGKDHTKTNIMVEVPQIKEVYTKEFRAKMPWAPRPPPKMLAKKERLKTPWDFFKSVFKGKIIFSYSL